MKETSNLTQNERGCTQFAVPYTTRVATKLEMTEHCKKWSRTDVKLHLLIEFHLQNVAYLDHPMSMCCFLLTRFGLAGVGAPEQSFSLLFVVSKLQPCRNLQRFCTEDPWLPKAFGRREESGGRSGEQKANTINHFLSRVPHIACFMTFLSPMPI